MLYTALISVGRESLHQLPVVCCLAGTYDDVFTNNINFIISIKWKKVFSGLRKRESGHCKPHFLCFWWLYFLSKAWLFMYYAMKIRPDTKGAKAMHFLHLCTYMQRCSLQKLDSHEFSWQKGKALTTHKYVLIWLRLKAGYQTYRSWNDCFLKRQYMLIRQSIYIYEYIYIYIYQFGQSRPCLLKVFNDTDRAFTTLILKPPLRILQTVVVFHRTHGNYRVMGPFSVSYSE